MRILQENLESFSAKILSVRHPALSLRTFCAPLSPCWPGIGLISYIPGPGNRMSRGEPKIVTFVAHLTFYLCPGDRWRKYQ
jgi:hypothetical protein